MAISEELESKIADKLSKIKGLDPLERGRILAVIYNSIERNKLNERKALAYIPKLVKHYIKNYQDIYRRLILEKPVSSNNNGKKTPLLLTEDPYSQSSVEKRIKKYREREEKGLPIFSDGVVGVRIGKGKLEIRADLEPEIVQENEGLEGKTKSEGKIETEKSHELEKRKPLRTIHVFSAEEIKFIVEQYQKLWLEQNNRKYASKIAEAVREKFEIIRYPGVIRIYLKKQGIKLPDLRQREYGGGRARITTGKYVGKQKRRKPIEPLKLVEPPKPIEPSLTRKKVAKIDVRYYVDFRVFRNISMIQAETDYTSAEIRTAVASLGYRINHTGHIFIGSHKAKPFPARTKPAKRASS